MSPTDTLHRHQSAVKVEDLGKVTFERRWTDNKTVHTDYFTAHVDWDAKWKRMSICHSVFVRNPALWNTITSLPSLIFFATRWQCSPTWAHRTVAPPLWSAWWPSPYHLIYTTCQHGFITKHMITATVQDAQQEPEPACSNVQRLDHTSVRHCGDEVVSTALHFRSSHLFTLLLSRSQL